MAWLDLKPLDLMAPSIEKINALSYSTSCIHFSKFDFDLKLLEENEAEKISRMRLNSLEESERSNWLASSFSSPYMPSMHLVLLCKSRPVLGNGLRLIHPNHFSLQNHHQKSCLGFLWIGYTSGRRLTCYLWQLISQNSYPLVAQVAQLYPQGLCAHFLSPFTIHTSYDEIILYPWPHTGMFHFELS